MPPQGQGIFLFTYVFTNIVDPEARLIFHALGAERFFIGAEADVDLSSTLTSIFKGIGLIMHEAIFPPISTCILLVVSGRENA